MTLILSGTDGLSDVDGTAATPAIRGTDTNTGIFFPAADTIAFSEGGTEVMRIDSSGNLNLATNGSALQWNNAGNNCYIAGNSGQMAFATGTSSYVEQARISAAGLFQFNSGYGSVATAYGCRAWVNFNGTGTVAIRASGNVTSITDNGTGDYTVNFTNAMPDANYATVATSIAENTGFGSTTIKLGTTPTTSAVNIRAIGNATYYDPSISQVAIFR